MPNQKDRIIIDTNLLISFLLTKDFSRFDSIISGQNPTFIFSDILLNEFAEVIQRTKFKKYFNPEDAKNLLLKIRGRTDYIKVTTEVDICRDLKDNFLLNLAIDGQASHLITGDKDLLVLKKIKTTTILTITEYIEIFKPGL